MHFKVGFGGKSHRALVLYLHSELMALIRFIYFLSSDVH